MSDTESITFRLKVYNGWRRGNNAPQPDPKTVGEDIDSICDIAKRLEIERDEARERVKELVYENEKLYRRLESVRDQYRLSSVCRKLMIENQKLKGEQP